MYKKYIPILLLIVLFNLKNNVIFAQVAAFSASDSVGCDNLEVKFTDNSIGGITKWEWDFGDGSPISNLQSPTTFYSNPGIYNVKLTVYIGTNSNSITKLGLIKVHKSPVLAFSISDSEGCVPFNVNFSDESIPGDTAIANWSWIFGDGSSSPEQNPNYIYQTADKYTVKLIITDFNGCNDSEERKDAITVINNDLNANFTIDKPEACNLPHLVHFTNSTTGIVSSWNWNYGNGQTSSDSIPIDQSYNEYNIFNVSLSVQNAIGCVDTMKKTVTTKEFFATFSANKTEGCAPLSVSFLDNSIGATSRNWDFGGAGTAITPNPTFTFNIAGVYFVKLTSKKTGCTDDSTMVITVFANPIVTFTASDSSACKVPFNVNFESTTPSIDTWSWTFENGGTSTDEKPVVNYLVPGKFDVKLSVIDTNGCPGTLSTVDLIKVIYPIADFTIDKEKGCKDLDVAFTDLSVSKETITKWSWYYGNGDSLVSNNPNPLYQYTDTGSFSVKLVIENIEGCIDSIVKADTIVVGDHFNVNFMSANDSVCYNGQLLFTDLSDPVSDEWTWKFCDKGTDMTQNPNYKFANVDTGFCSVFLKAGFHGCYDSLLIPDMVYVLSPIAKFEIDKTLFCEQEVPYTSVYTELAEGENSYLWRFGDGDSTFTQNPSHTFLNPGIYNIELVVENFEYGCRDSISLPVTVSTITPNYTTSPTTGCPPLRVFYDNTSTGNIAINKFEWRFSDGSLPLLGDTISHVFANTTLNSLFFDDTLIVTNAVGCKDTLFNLSHIDVNPIPNVDFVSLDTTGCVPFTATFTDITIPENPIVKWDWKFGTTSISSLDKDTSFTFSPRGKYSVTLSAEDSEGCKASITKTNYIVATLPDTKFTVTDVLCDKTNSLFDNSSTATCLEDTLSYVWDFGDGSPLVPMKNQDTSHYYNIHSETSQAYTVILTATDKNNCSVSAQKNITVSIINAGFFPDKTDGNCPPFDVTFTDTSKTFPGDVNYWKWDFGDGIRPIDTSKPIVANQYLSAGTFGVSLIAKNQYGCSDTVKIDSLITVGGPLGNYTFSIDSSACVPSVDFVAHTDAVSIKWIFKDGKSDFTNDSTVSHKYLTPGDYYPVLILKDINGCQSSYVSDSAVVIDFPVVNVTVTALTSATCLDNGGSARVDASGGQQSPYTYLWENSDTAKIALGLYGGMVEVTVTDFVGCQGQDSVLINTVWAVISETVHTTDAICTENNGKIVLKPQTGNDPFTFVWDTGAIIDSIQNLAPNTYYYTITDSIGCYKESSATVGLGFANIVDNSTIQDAVCASNNGFIILSPSGGYPPYSYLWNTSQNDSAIHNLAPNAYSVTITDDYGCELFGGPYAINLIENNSILANFGFTPNDVIASIPINFTDSSSNIYPIANWKWYVDDEQIMDDTIKDFSHLFPEGGYYDVRLLITDEFGCTDDTTKMVTIKSGLRNANVFTPNGDGQNDFFTIVSSGIEEFTIHIYNRWGVLIFTETSQYINWTGKTTAGVDVPAGTYYYILKAKGKDGTVYDGDDYKGFITLLR